MGFTSDYALSEISKRLTKIEEDIASLKMRHEPIGASFSLPVCGIDLDSLKEMVESIKPKEETVVVFRHIRPRVNDYEDWLGYEDAKQGLTFCFALDFKHRIIRVGWAICNGDNFSKLMGRNISFQRMMKAAYVMNMPDGEGKFADSLVEMFSNEVESELGYYPDFSIYQPASRYMAVLRDFERAINKK